MFGSMSNSPEASCGAQSPVYAKGLGTWNKWYDSAHVSVPTLVPGGEFELEVQLTADHGGQAWLMVACGDHIGEDVEWTYLERSSRDRGHHFMPSNPGVYAWKTREHGYAKFTAQYKVPGDLSCPGGLAVGRWLWKTANTCLDENNLGRGTETFSRAEYEDAIGVPRGSFHLSTCAVPPEVFISCLDFKVIGENEGPAPTSEPTPTPAPTPAPTPEPTPTSGPTIAPTPAPSPPPSGPCSKAWGQCGGKTWSGATCCNDGLTCNRQSEWYSQCISGSSFTQSSQWSLRGHAVRNFEA